MYKLNAVFWDLDGTIANTEISGHRVAFNMSFKDFGLNWQWDIETYTKLLNIAGGFKRINYYNSLENTKLDYNLMKEIHKQKQFYYTDLVNSGEIPMRIGVKRLVYELANLNIQQWIVTSSSMKATFPLVKKFFVGHKDIFNGYVTSEDVALTKPNPEPYLTAIHLSKLKSESIIVIEDSVIGSSSARRAGLKTLITLNEDVNIKLSEFEEDSCICNSLGDINNPSYLLKGPSLHTKYITTQFLSDIINQD